VQAVSKKILPFITCLSLLFTGCSERDTGPAKPGPDDAYQVSGAVVITAGGVLPDDARLEVVLEDVSVADIAAPEIARFEGPVAGPSPHRFELAYRPADIDAGNRYSLRASLFLGDRLGFVSTENFDPFASPEGADIVLSLSAVPERPTVPLASLVNTYWKLTSLRDSPVTMAEGQEREASMVLQGEPAMAKGFAGCNRFSGGYQYAGDSLTLGPLASTKKACAVGMTLETEFLGVLDDTRLFNIEGDTLELLNDQQTVIATFVAVYLH